MRRVDIHNGSSSLPGAQVSPQRVRDDPLPPIKIPERGRDEQPRPAAQEQNAGEKSNKLLQRDIHKPRKKNAKPEAVDEEAPKDTKPLGHQSHAIPNILTFTHSINLLNATKVTGEDVALQRNVRNTIKLHPNADIHFLTDQECIASIRRVLGDDSPLVDFFQKESHGMYKADICRGASLYETGGLYFDVDIQARMPMWEAISDKTTFVTSRVHRQSKYPGAFFQAFIGVTPRNPIMMRYLQLFIKHYQGHIDVQGPLGVLLLRKAHDEIISTTKQQQDVELWQEVLYSKQYFPKVPPPSWGTRRACHFVVVANQKPPFVVPLYSRVQGSRMCGGKESNKNLRGGK